MTYTQALNWPGELRAEPGERSRWVLIRRGIAAPSVILAAVGLGEPGIGVRLIVRVDPGGSVRVAELSVHAREMPTRAAITARALRAVRLDALARDAVRQVEREVIMRDDVMPGAFQVPGEDPNSVWIPGRDRIADRRPTPRELAESAARIYTEAKNSGSRAPTQAVAAELFCSRSHASRLIRSARDLGLLANPSQATPTQSAPPESESRTKPEPEPPIFRDPNEPRPWEENEGRTAVANDQDD